MNYSDAVQLMDSIEQDVSKLKEAYEVLVLGLIDMGMSRVQDGTMPPQIGLELVNLLKLAQSKLPTNT